MNHPPFKPYQDQPDSDLVVELANNLIQVSGIVGDPENWQYLFSARCVKRNPETGRRETWVQPITLMVNFQLQDFTSNPVVACRFQTDLRLRWSSEKGGGEAILDAAAGQIITVCAGEVSIEGNHKGNPATGGAALFQIAGFVGTVPHPPPIRTQTLDLAAGATSPRIAIPAWTTRTYLGGNARPDNLDILQGYPSNNPVTAALFVVEGFEPIPGANGCTHVDVTNASVAARTVVLVHELAF